MLYKEFQEQVWNRGLRVNDDVWVVDFQYDDARKSPVRNIPPTHARITTAHDDQPNAAVYWGRQYQFRPLGQDGTPKNNAISRYSANRRFFINVFLTQDEAEEFYTQQCLAAKEQLEEAARVSHEKFMNSLQDVERRLQRNR